MKLIGVMRTRRIALRTQRGISLFVVLVMVLLTTLMVLASARTSLFNELVIGNDSDYQRAFEAAQAMVRDAELDILGQRADGSSCDSVPSSTYCRPAKLPANINVATKQVYFPAPTYKGENESDLESLIAAYAALPAGPSCLAGICTSTSLDPEFWTKASGTLGLPAMKALGARYGQYTGAKSTDVGSTAAGNPLLKSTSATDARAFYWVEPLKFASAGSQMAIEYGPGGTRAGTGTVNGIVYRITAVASGVKPGTQAVIQTVFVIKAPD